MPPVVSSGSSRPSLARILAFVAVTSSGLVAAPARAQDTTAEAVFEEGVKLFEAGDYAAACPKLKSAVSLSSSEALGGRLVLAECYEKLGRWASAWGLYREIAPKAATSGQAARREKAEAGRARVEPRLPRLKIVLGPGVATLPGLTLDRDGETIPKEAWDIALPVDPGTAVLTARATGKRASVQRITVVDAPSTTTVTIDRLEDEPTTPGAPLAPSAPITGAEPPPPPPTSPGPTSEGLSGLGIAGIVVGATGVVGMGVSTLVAASAASSWDQAVDDEDEQGVDDALGTGNVATGVFVAGAVLTAVGVTLLIVDLGSAATAPASARVHLRTTGLGASAGGTF